MTPPQRRFGQLQQGIAAVSSRGEVRRRLTDALETERAPDLSPAQLMAIREITDVLRTIVMRCWRVREAHPNEKSFQLFEMHADIASMLGLEEGCWIMLELSGQSPTVIFEDRDLCGSNGNPYPSLNRRPLRCTINSITRPHLCCSLGSKSR
jgi:hypothetical protein